MEGSQELHMAHSVEEQLRTEVQNILDLVEEVVRTVLHKDQELRSVSKEEIEKIVSSDSSNSSMYALILYLSRKATEVSTRFYALSDSLKALRGSFVLHPKIYHHSIQILKEILTFMIAGSCGS